MRRVLLTGGGGLIGTTLIPALRAAGWTTRCLIHRTGAPDADEIVDGDLQDLDSLRKAARGVDAVLHLAAMTHARKRRAYFSVNVDGTRNLIRAIDRGTLRRLVLVSSHTASMDGGNYSESKLRAEEVVRSSGLPHTIVRLPEIYGTNGTEGVEWIVSRAKLGSVIPLVGSGSQRICPLYLDDVIDPIVNALDSEVALNRTYTLASEYLTVREFADACIEASGTDSRIVAVPRLAIRVLCGIASVAPIPLAPDQLQRLEGPRQDGSPEAKDHLGFSPQRLRERLREQCQPPA